MMDSRLIVPDTPSSDISIDRFELRETLSPGGSASAYLLYWNAATGRLISSGLPVTVYDLYDLANSDGINFGVIGERIRARYHPDTGRYECVGSQGLFRHGKTDEAITAGNSGTVSVWAGNPLADTGVNVEVSNTWGGPNLAQAQEIFIRYVPDARIWVPTESGRNKARWIRFQVDNVSGFAATDASVSATVAMYADGPDPGASLTVYNMPNNNTGNYTFAGDDDDYGYAMYRPEDDRYYIWQMECE